MNCRDEHANHEEMGHVRVAVISSNIVIIMKFLMGVDATKLLPQIAALTTRCQSNCHDPLEACRELGLGIVLSQGIMISLQILLLKHCPLSYREVNVLARTTPLHIMIDQLQWRHVALCIPPGQRISAVTVEI
jgi:hypothetical protein